MLPRNSNRQKNIAVIVNPSSAGGKTLLRWPEFEQSLITAGFSVTKHFSTSESDFRETVKYFSRKFKMIGVCGGDSSLTIAAEELQEKKFRGELVFFPAGSVNDLVLAIGAHSLKPRSIFLGNLEGPADQKLFIGQANWGLGVVVNRWVGKILAALPFLRPVTGLIGFVCIVVAHVLHRELVEAEIIAGKSRSKGEPDQPLGFRFELLPRRIVRQPRLSGRDREKVWATAAHAHHSCGQKRRPPRL